MVICEIKTKEELIAQLEALLPKREYWKNVANDAYDKWKLEGGEYPRASESQFDIYDGMIRGLNYALGRTKFI